MTLEQKVREITLDDKQYEQVMAVFAAGMVTGVAFAREFPHVHPATDDFLIAVDAYSKAETEGYGGMNLANYIDSLAKLNLEQKNESGNKTDLV